MIRKFLNNFSQDLSNALRDNMMLYILSAPLILAVIFKFFIPSVETAPLRAAVSVSLPSNVRQGLELGLDLEILDTEAAVISRVAYFDDTPGIILSNGSPVLLFQGNENPELKETVALFLEKVIYRTDQADFRFINTGGGRSWFREYVIIMLLLLAGLLGGALSGFNIVEDRDTETIRAMAISPMTTMEYMLSKSLFTLILSLTVAALTALILNGFHTDWPRLALAMALSLPVSAALGFTIGFFARNQIGAVGVIKIIMPIFITIPIVSLFTPSSWQWVYYILPNYWMFSAIGHIFLDHGLPLGFWASAVITFIYGLVVCALLILPLKRKLGLR